MAGPLCFQLVWQREVLMWILTCTNTPSAAVAGAWCAMVSQRLGLDASEPEPHLR
jgi:hypothetical protein